MTQTQARMGELHTKQSLEGPPHTSRSTKTQVGTSTFPASYVDIFNVSLIPLHCLIA